MSLRTLFILIAITLLVVPQTLMADTVVREWQSGPSFGWYEYFFTNLNTVASPWYGETDSNESFLIYGAGYDGLPIPATSPKHYLEVRMRMKNVSTTDEFFSYDTGYLKFNTDGDFQFYDTKKIEFETYGTGGYHTYKIMLGEHPDYTGNLAILGLFPTTRTSTVVEIDRIRLMEDDAAPQFTVKNIQGYEDNQIITDTTPKIVLRDVFDQGSGVDRAEFYYRPATSDSDADWVLAGTDTDSNMGYRHAYSSLAPGSYDFSVVVYDNFGNHNGFTDSPDCFIDNITIDPAAAPAIKVETDNVVRELPKDIPSHNFMWHTEKRTFNNSTGEFNAAMEARIDELKIPIARFPGGCYSDTFYWKTTIGPVDERPDSFTNGCNPTLYNQGPVTFGIDEYLTYCESRGIKPMITCRFRYTDSPNDSTPQCSLDADPANPFPEALQDAVDLVEYCNAPNDGSNPNGGTDWAAERAANGHPEPYNVKYFEIGNEPWGPDPFGSPRPNGEYGKEAATVYAMNYVKFRNAMKEVDPTIYVSAAGNHGTQPHISPDNPTWDTTIYELIGNQMDAMHTHPYKPYSAFWNVDDDSRYWQVMATPRRLDDDMEVQRYFIRKWSDGRLGELKLWLNEWSINYGWRWENNIYEGDSLMTAIALTDTWSVWATNGDVVESTEWWHLGNGRPYYLVSSKGAVSPNFYSFKIYTNRYQDDIVHSQINGVPVQSWNGLSWDPYFAEQHDIPLLTSFATVSEDGLTLSLTVINKDKNSDHQSTVDISDFTSTSIDASIWELNGTDPHNVHYVNGSYNTSTSDASMSESTGNYSPVFTYDFPAHSVTNFVFELEPVVMHSVSEVKQAADNTLVSVSGNIVSAVFADHFYMQDPQRISGIKVVTPEGVTVTEGDTVDVVGKTSTDTNGERQIEATSVTVTASGERPDPMAIINKNAGGGPYGEQLGLFDYHPRPIPENPEEFDILPGDVYGLNTIGLFVKTWGEVVYIAPDQSHFYISDGSPIYDDGQQLGLRVEGPCPAGMGDFLIANGVPSCIVKGGNYVRTFKVAAPEDIEVVSL